MRMQTSAPPKIIEGVEFRCYKTSPWLREWQTIDGAVSVSGGYGRPYVAIVGTERLPTQFRKFETAAKAAIKTLRVMEGLGK